VDSSQRRHGGAFDTAQVGGGRIRAEEYGAGEREASQSKLVQSGSILSGSTNCSGPDGEHQLHRTCRRAVSCAS
jgi:hypothetical protein